MLVIVSIRSSNQRGVFGVGVLISAVFIVGAIFTARFLRLGPARLDDLLPEASRINLHVFDAREAGVSGVARLPDSTRLVTMRIARCPRASFLGDRAVLISMVVLVGVRMTMRMLVVAVVVSARSMGVAVSAENDEANEVRGKTK